MLGVFIFYTFLLRAPSEFPRHSFYAVEEGTSVSAVATSLYGAHMIKSPGMFKAFVVFSGSIKGVLAGDYFFAEPENAFSLARRLILGNHQLQPLRVTIPEGFSVHEIATILNETLSEFDEEYFIEHAHEGYVFPDTYLILPNATAQSVLLMMERNFENNIKKLEADIQVFGKSLEDVITMASIIEEEARTSETRDIISGILWRRLAIGMPLQVDVTFQYINGKNTYELSLDDLAIDSPYNTYKYAGLPPTPISNPGFDSIRAAVHPRDTPYLYFLSSKNGTMYYATDFEGHKKNRILYLN